MTSRFRDIENKVESQSGQALGAQRLCLFREDTVEMMRRDTRVQDSVIIMLKVNPKNFNNHADLTKIGTINTEGAQLRNVCAEARTVNASITPEVTRLSAREAQLATTLRNKETELEGRLLTLHQKNAWLNDLMNPKYKYICGLTKFWIGEVITNVEIRTRSRSD